MKDNKKKIYEIVWEGIYTSPIQISRVSLIVAKNEEQALKKFYKKYNNYIPSILSFREYKNPNEEHGLPQEVLSND